MFLIILELPFDVFILLEGASFSGGPDRMSPPSRLVWANVLRSDLRQVHCGFDSTERQVVIVVVQSEEHQTGRVTTAWGRRARWESVDGKVLCFVFGREGRELCDWFVVSQRGCRLLQILTRICTLLVWFLLWSLVLTLGKAGFSPSLEFTTPKSKNSTCCSCKPDWGCVQVILVKMITWRAGVPQVFVLRCSAFWTSVPPTTHTWLTYTFSSMCSMNPKSPPWWIFHRNLFSHH